MKSNLVPPGPPGSTGSTIRSESERMGELIRRIVETCPRRQPASPDERRAQEIMQRELEQLGLETRWHHFSFSDNIHANYALHFGMGVLGTAVSGVAPGLAAALHGLGAASFWAESTRRGYLLRRMLPFKPSQNLVATLPARREPSVRILWMAHADAGFTGLFFDPRLLHRLSGEPPALLKSLRRPIALATRAQGLLVAFDALRLLGGPLTWGLRPLEWGLTLPSLLVTLLNLEILFRNRVVPGAHDNLSGVAALLLLAQRFLARTDDQLEHVFVVTGCEEAGLGGADALVDEAERRWGPCRTVAIALDGLCGGDLRLGLAEGEVSTARTTPWLAAAAQETAQSDTRFARVTPFEIPVGGTDAGPFLARGWDALSLVCIDPELGAPRNYHVPSDTPENLDLDRLVLSVDFAEALARTIRSAHPRGG